MVAPHIIGLAVAAAVLPLAAPWLGFVFTLAVGKGLAALGVALLLRGGLISIGHALYFAVGAYATAFLMRSGGINELVLLLVLSTLVATIAGLFVGTFMVRYRAIFFRHAQSRGVDGVLHAAFQDVSSDRRHRRTSCRDAHYCRA